MIVDDEYMLRNNMVRKIEQLQMGFVVTTEASNGQEALELLAKNDIQLVISDIRMPGTDGLSLCKIIHNQFPGVLTILLTGYADFEYSREALRYGVSDYLLKPVEMEDLRNSFYHILPVLEKEYELDNNSSNTLNSTDDLVEYMLSYLREHYMEDIDMGELAHKFGVTSSYLSQQFRKKTGDSPIRYLTEIRINEAKRLLIQTQASISEIGIKVGYPDQFYFSKTFRKLEGKSPHAFRKEQLE